VNTSSSISPLPEQALLERKNNLRYIISGGPGFGKTSIIKELENRKYKSIHEISRSIIKEQMEKGGDILPWKNLKAFSGLVFEQRLNQHSNAPSNEVCFYDRGIVDVLAYLKNDALHVPSSYIEASRKFHYNQIVFLTPPWREIYLMDNERKEDFEKAFAIHQLIELTYKQMGYHTQNIPLLNVEARVDFILSKINNSIL
jgi:predicted ATPase